MRHEFDPWVGEIPWRRAWQPTLVFLPGESHGQRSLSATKSRKESDVVASIPSDFNFSVPSLFSYCSRDSLLVLLLTTLIICICGPCQLFLSFCSGASFLLFSMIPSYPTTSLIFLCMYDKSLQSWPILCEPMDCTPPGFSVHGILQARILKCVAMPFSRGSSQPKAQTCISYISCIGRSVLYH